jgi:hypothetical protein
MSIRKFNEFLKDREIIESGLNRSAMDYSKKLAEFNARFDDPKQGEEIVKSAGYASIGDFLRDTNERKWSKLKMPGQENYVR